MQLFIYFSVVFFTISSAQQLKNGPLISPEQLYSSSQKIDERYVTPELDLYFTPDEVQALQARQSSQNSASFQNLKPSPEIGAESYNELIQKFFTENLKPAPIEESQVEQRHSSSNFFLPKDESIISNKPNFNFNLYKQMLLDQTKLSRYSQRNKLNQPSFFKPGSEANKNKDQRKSAVEKEREYILQNGRIYQSRQLNSPIKVRSQNSDINVDQEKSAIQKEIENAWRQYQAHEFERLNSPAEISKQILSARYKNQEKMEVRKPILYSLRNDQAHEFERLNSPAEISKQIPSARYKNQEKMDVRKPILYSLRNDQAYGFERLNAPTDTSNQGSENRNEGQNESEVEKELKKFWGKHQNSQLQTAFLSAGFSNQGSSGINKNKEKSEVDKQIENIFKQQDFGFERLYSPDASSPKSFR